jgi:hypothetical protein
VTPVVTLVAAIRGAAGALLVELVHRPVPPAREEIGRLPTGGEATAERPG